MLDIKLAKKDIYKNSAKQSYEVFLRLMMPNIVISKHHKLIIQKLEQIERGELKRLIITLPPRCGKTLLCSEYFPAWFLGKNPDKYIIASTYSQERASDNGRKVRNIFNEEIYQYIFDKIRLAKDSHAQHKFSIANHNGVYFAVGAGAALTGRGSHVFLCDDVIKNKEEAYSEIMSRKLKEWFTTVAYTRLMKNGAIVLIMTRWHENDLAGWILREHKHDNWEVVNLPAIAEENDILGRKEGEALWPEFFDIKALENIKQTLYQVSKYDWSALYQQRPMPCEGGIFKINALQYYDTMPKEGFTVQSWDTAYKLSDTSSYTVCQTWRVSNNGYYLLNQLRQRLEYPELRASVKTQYQEYNPNVVLVEDKASGQSVVQELRRDTRIPIIPIKPGAKDKEVRAQLIAPLIDAGKVYLPKTAKYLDVFLQEISNFPASAHDDQVDAMSQALTYLKNKSVISNAKIITSNH